MSNSKIPQIKTAANQHSEGIYMIAQGLVSLGTLFGLFRRSTTLGLFSSYSYGKNVVDTDQSLQFETIYGEIKTWPKVLVKRCDSEGGCYEVLEPQISNSDQIEMNQMITPKDRNNGATWTTYSKCPPPKKGETSPTIELQPHMWKFGDELKSQLFYRILFIQIPITLPVIKKWWNNEISLQELGKKVAHGTFLSLCVSVGASLTNCAIPFIIDGFVSKKGVKCKIVLIVLRFGSEYFWTKVYNHFIDETNYPSQLNDTIYEV